MKKKELIERWKTGEIKDLRKKIINHILKHRPIETLEGLSKNNDYWDLRGISFPLPEEMIKIYSYDFPLKVFLVKNLKLNNIDFSHANLKYSWWEKCEIHNGIFEDSNMSQVTIEACRIVNSTFKNVNFKDASLGLNKGKDSGEFAYSKFINCNLSQVSFAFPVIQNCEFIDCKLKEVNFNGSRLKDCKFTGHFESGWFRAYDIYGSTSFLGSLISGVNTKNYINEMENVDFSSCDLEDVMFSHGIDLRSCKFPQGEKYLFVKNVGKLYTKAKKEIENIWKGEDKVKALALIDRCYYANFKRNMPVDFVNLGHNTIDPEPEFEDKFNSLLVEINKGL